MVKEKVVDYSSANPERTKLFFEAVNAQVEAETNAIIRESEEEKKKIIKKSNDTFTKRAYNDVKDNARKSSGKYALIANKAEFEAHKDILRYRDTLVQKLFSEVEDKLSEFRKTDDYKVFLQKSLETEEKSDDMIVYLMPDDMKYKDFLSETADVEFKTDSSIKLGGLSVCYPDKSVIVDKTFDTLLIDEKRNFASGDTLVLNDE